MAGYEYSNLREKILSDEGQVLVMKAASNARRLIGVAGAVRWDKVVEGIGTADSWAMIAVTDRLVEMGVLVAITPDGTRTQGAIFIGGPLLG